MSALFPVNVSDAVFIAKVIDFFVFVAALVFLYERVLKTQLVRHQENVNKQVAEATRAREQAEAAVVAAQTQLEKAGHDAARMVEVAGQQAERLSAAQRAAAKEHARRVVANARGELERERYRVRHDLLLDTVERAYARAKDIARREFDAAAQARLVSGLMTELEARGRV